MVVIKYFGRCFFRPDECFMEKCVRARAGTHLDGLTIHVRSVRAQMSISPLG